MGRGATTLGLVVLGAALAVALDNGLGRVPPMGWNSWNHFNCDVNETVIRETADLFVSTGLKDAGYEYVNIDDCWQLSRDEEGNIVPDAHTFPSGMKALADYVHAKGLKFGVYSCAGTKTCQGRPGSYNHEVQDAKSWASWGVDYVKVDWCYTDGLDPKVQYTKLRDALNATGRPIFFSLCDWGIGAPWEWGMETGNSWRTSGDISDSFPSMLSNIDGAAPYADKAGPGGWNDPDMLEIGNGGMTPEEYRSHMSLWAILPSPLLAGNDLSKMDQTTLDTLLAPEVIGVNQDAAGIPGKRIHKDTTGQVWIRPLQDGRVAAVLFNDQDAEHKMTLKFSDVGMSGSAMIRDLWARKDLGVYTGSFTATVASHASVMVTLVTTGLPIKP